MFGRNTWLFRTQMHGCDTAFDGFMRLGTNREILSCPATVAKHIRQNRGDEAKAQARLKAERLSTRKNHQDYIAFKQSWSSRTDRDAMQTSRGASENAS